MATKKSAKKNTKTVKKNCKDCGTNVFGMKVVVVETALLAAVLLLGGIALAVCGHKYLDWWPDTSETKTDAAMFAEDYLKVADDNVFVYRSADEVVKILEHGTGVVFLGFPECPWCQAYAPYLNEVAKEVGISKVYYLDILEDRKNNTEAYQQIVSLLDGKLQFDEEGKARVYVPDAAFVVNGEIIGNDYESSKDTGGASEPAEYWTEEKVTALKERLKNYMQEVKAAEASCVDVCNE